MTLFMRLQRPRCLESRHVYAPRPMPLTRETFSSEISGELQILESRLETTLRDRISNLFSREGSSSRVSFSTATTHPSTPHVEALDISWHGKSGDRPWGLQTIPDMPHETGA